MTKTGFAAATMATLFAACGQPQYRSFPYELYGYAIEPVAATPLGINLDPTGQDIDLAALDRQALEVEHCLEDTFGNGQGQLDVRDVDWCGYGPPLTTPVDWSLITVKIPDDYIEARSYRMQLLRDLAPEEGCLEKERNGQLPPDPKNERSCHWRVGIQDSTIVVTPSLYLLKDGLVKMITGCWDAWHDPRLANCSRPTVPPVPQD